MPLSVESSHASYGAFDKGVALSDDSSESVPSSPRWAHTAPVNEKGIFCCPLWVSIGCRMRICSSLAVLQLSAMVTVEKPNLTSCPSDDKADTDQRTVRIPGTSRVSTMGTTVLLLVSMSVTDMRIIPW